MNRVSYSSLRLLRAPYSLTLIAFKDGAITSLGKLFQCLTTLSQKKTLFPYTHSRSPLFLFETISPCPTTTDSAKECPHFLLIVPLHILKGRSQVSPKHSLLQAEQPQLSQSILVGEVFHPLDHFFFFTSSLHQQHITVIPSPISKPRKKFLVLSAPYCVLCALPASPYITRHLNGGLSQLAPSSQTLPHTYRFIETLRLKKTSKIIWTNSRPTVPTKPRPLRPHLHDSLMSAGTVTLPTPWAACVNALPLFLR